VKSSMELFPSSLYLNAKFTLTPAGVFCPNAGMQKMPFGLYAFFALWPDQQNCTPAVVKVLH